MSIGPTYQRFQTGLIYEQFEEVCRKSSEKLALIYLGKGYTYSQLKEAIESLALSLYELGVTKGDKVMLYLTNCPQWVIAWLALLRIGAAVVPISPIYTPFDLRYMANDAEVETIFCLDTNFGYVAQVLPETSLKRVIICNVAELLPWLKRFIALTFNKIPTGRVNFKKMSFYLKSF